MAEGSTHVGFRSQRGPTLISLMLSMSLVAIDSTIIATAVPSVVADLGGFGQFPWLFSVYLLAQAVSVPIYGKLADQFGRKPIMLVGIGLFLAGSILCATAWSMLALIAFRTLQGLGAGAIQPMSMTIAGDIYTLQERGRVQGYLASVWGASAVIGPTLGGVFSEYLSWRWIFIVNIPLCAVAAWALIRNFREQVVRHPHRIDYAGSALLALGCSLLILGLLEGGQAWAWISAPGVGVIVAGVALMALFVLVQRRAAEPILPAWVLRRRILVAGNLAALGVGAVLIGLTSYVPTFAQRVLGTSPLVAGFALAALTVGWPITSSQSSKAYLRIGFRATALIGSAVTILGTALTAMLGAHSSVALVGFSCFVVGAGLGFVAAPILIAAQNTVGWAERGVVTATNMFSRSIGSALGVAFFGAIANASLRSGPSSVPAFARAFHHVFIGAAVVAVLMGLAAAMMPHTASKHDAVTALAPDAAQA
ncbi:MAG TPA: MDR family MFS transporter [Streptosporangiaceae bacterium]|nr:MDR family MFS transporter [Streptosporangiaceae bacterium]